MAPAPVRLIDTHVHFWHPQRLKYSWLHDSPFLNRRYEVQDYPTQDAVAAVEALVFVECDADPGQSLRGIRRILQSLSDPNTLLRNSDFIDGARLLRKFGLHFEITVNYTQMESVIEFVQKVPEIPMVLDHCGKPGIRGGHLEAFQRHANELARCPNVHCKLSGLATEADHRHWSDAQLIPYIDTALQAFGPERLLYGSDWPVCLLATSISRWIGVLERALKGCSQEQLEKIFRDNANGFYRLGLA
jgi:L-fuconolactonase